MGRSAMNRPGNVGEFYVVWIVAHPVYDLLWIVSLTPNPDFKIKILLNVK